MNFKPIVLVGMTCSGKDTICKQLVNMGFNKVVTYTTRPMRPDEEDGITYHFVSSEWFKNKQKNGFFLETKSYKVANGDTWMYGSPKKISSNSVIILTPSGLKAVKDAGIDVTSIYLKADVDTLKNRLRSRGDNEEEANRRLKSDISDFQDIEKEVDIVITNQNISTKNVVNAIFELAKLEGKR